MLIVDAHLDLAMNAIEWTRDLTRPIEEIRAREAGMSDKPDRGLGTVSFGEMRRGNVGLCVATQIARFVASIVILMDGVSRGGKAAGRQVRSGTS
jgi:membrane dipeptidase